jgi:hypothetical protein
VIVDYDPKNPQNALVEDPHAQLWSETIFIAMSVAILPTAIVLGWRYGMFSRQRWAVLTKPLGKAGEWKAKGDQNKSVEH